MTKLQSFLFALPFLALACSDDSNNGTGPGLGGAGSTGSGSTPKASTEQVSQCKDGCDQQKFHKCYDADDHSKCLAACDVANTTQADQFIRCVGSSICDEECTTQLSKPPATNNGTGGTSSGTNDGSKCGQACAKATSCGASVKSSCVSECQAATAAGQVPAGALDCVIDTPCEQIGNECGFGFEDGETDGPVDDTSSCEFTCTTIAQQECIAATELAKCKAHCKEATKQRREDFGDCSFVAHECDSLASCYDAFKE